MILAHNDLDGAIGDEVKTRNLETRRKRRKKTEETEEFMGVCWQTKCVSGPATILIERYIPLNSSVSSVFSSVPSVFQDLWFWF